MGTPHTEAPSAALPTAPVQSPMPLSSAVAGGATAKSPGTLALIDVLCRALEAERIRYCHWKSNAAIARSATGENDLDLLVSRSDVQGFEQILRRLGFRDTELPAWKRLPGISHWYGLDEATGTLVHIHAHYQLVIGDDMTKNYRLPIEEAYLDSAAGGTPFRLPAPEFEFAVFLVRMVLKHCTWDAIWTPLGSLSASEREELAELLGQVDPAHVWERMGRHLPFVPSPLWDRCLRSVRPGASIWFRVRTASRLERALAACGRRPRAADISLKVWRRVRTVVRRKVLRRGPVPQHLSTGGALIAFVGGDGAGKSTAVDDLSTWLAKEFPTTRVHLGKPPRSLLSAAVKNLMGVAASMSRSPTSSASALRTSMTTTKGGSMGLVSTARLAWEVLTARDRYRAHARARRGASNGSIVICDRYPLRRVELMDGAVTASMADPSRWGRVVAYLAHLERSYYGRIPYPDILIVLKVDPDVAVQRKLGEERESFLRPRSEEIWRKDWAGTPAIVIDAGRPKAEVLSEIRSVVWSKL